MRFLFKALLAATALIPVASTAVAQEPRPGREGRQWRGDVGARADMRGGGERRTPRAAMRQAPDQQRDRPTGGTDRRGDATSGPRADMVTPPRAQAQPSARREWNANGSVNPMVDGGSSARRSRDGVRQGNAFAGIDNRRRAERGTFQRAPGVAFGAPGDPGATARLDRMRDERVREDRDRDGRRTTALRDERAVRQNDRGFGGRNDGRNDGRGNDWNRGRRGDDSVRGNRNDRAGWNSGWRNNRSYDWNGYRSSNRSAYRLPRYYAPYGWNNGYRRFSVGITLNSVLFGENYWIDDAYDYRLPAAYGPYRWVRYYNDALLVDVRYGRVVDVVHDIFW